MDRQHAQTYSTPSPGDILRRQALKAKPAVARDDGNAGPTRVALNTFQGGHRVEATRERGVVLAPIVVQWTYQVGNGALFAKWLRTKEILLADARLEIAPETSGIHYFGSYLGADGEGAGEAGGIDCQTLWGFSRREAMDHFFSLGRGEVARKAIVETDLKDFLNGLRGFIREFDATSFRQSVFVSAQVE